MRLTVSNAIKLTKKCKRKGSASGDENRRNTVFSNNRARIVPSRAEWQERALQKVYRVDAVAPQSLAAKIDRIRKIEAETVFRTASCHVHLPGSSLRKVKDDESG